MYAGVKDNCPSTDYINCLWTISCAVPEHFKPFLYWYMTIGTDCNNLQHYLEEVLMAGALIPRHLVRHSSNSVYKLCHLLDMLMSVGNRKKITLRDILLLLGHLKFTCTVILPGRAFVGVCIKQWLGI